MLTLDRQEFLAPRDIAKMLGIALPTFYSWQRNNTFPLKKVKIGGRFFYRKQEVENYIRKLTSLADS